MHTNFYLNQMENNKVVQNWTETRENAHKLSPAVIILELCSRLPKGAAARTTTFASVRGKVFQLLTASPVMLLTLASGPSSSPEPNVCQL